MARRISRGEIWSYPFRPPDRKRPVLILTRQEVIGLLNTVMVAPITSTIRGVPSEVAVGVEEGLKHPSALKLDRVQTVEQAKLTGYVGHVSSEKMREVCRALVVATGCESQGALRLVLKSEL